MIHQNEKGITLIEVVASIVILFFIVISFMNFFPQMGKSNIQTGNKQQAINLARSELLYWQEEIDKEFLETPSETTLDSDVNRVELVNTPSNSIKILTTTANSMNTVTNKFDIEVLIKLESDLTTAPRKANLIQINIYKEHSIQNNSLVSGTYPISSTYGYVFIEDESHD